MLKVKMNWDSLNRNFHKIRNWPSWPCWQNSCSYTISLCRSSNLGEILIYLIVTSMDCILHTCNTCSINGTVQ